MIEKLLLFPTELGDTMNAHTDSPNAHEDSRNRVDLQFDLETQTPRMLFSSSLAVR